MAARHLPDSHILNVRGKPMFDERIQSYQYHFHTPIASTTYNANDTIIIPINQQDVFTLPSESFLYIEGSLTTPDGKSISATHSLVNNAMAFLFDEIRWEISNIEVERLKNVGILTTIKQYLTRNPSDLSASNGGWDINGKLHVGAVDGKFVFCIPLNKFFSSFADYNKILLNVRQQLVLLRSPSDNDAVIATGDAVFKINLTKVYWRIPYIRVDDVTRLDLFKVIDKDLPIAIPFRKWELHEYPSIPGTKSITWTVKTASQVDKPRYVLVAFQTNRKNDTKKDSSKFDSCSIRNIRLYLNSTYFPYENVNGDMSLFYDAFTRFKASYFAGGSTDQGGKTPVLDFASYKSQAPIYVIDCSRQNESIKTGSVDVRLEIETDTNFPTNTNAFCIIVFDEILQYQALTGAVNTVL